MPVDFDDHLTSGLGLKIMRVFAGQLGGDVRVTSDPGKGASFQLHFPVLPGAA
jgi:signal transduction histidine kinase